MAHRFQHRYINKFHIWIQKCVWSSELQRYELQR
jgi:hypothetical protein